MSLAGTLLPVQAQLLELSGLVGNSGLDLNGAAAYDRAGEYVSSAGDVNGDGIDDLIIGAPRAAPNGNRDAGTSYVVFGNDQGFSRPIELSDLNGTSGFAIIGTSLEDVSGASVSSAGDVNGDGFDDVIIGAPGADPNGQESGTSYLEYGSTDIGLLSFPRIVTTVDKSTIDNYGWILFEDGTKQWVDATCRADLQRAGLGLEILPWLGINAYPDRTPIPCDDITSDDGSDGDDAEQIDITLNATPKSFLAMGDQITVEVTVTNRSDELLTSTTVNDPLLGDPLCMFDLWLGLDAICTGVYFVSDADVAAGEVTFTSTLTSDQVAQPITESLIVPRGETSNDESFPRILTTADKQAPGNYGWVMYESGNKHWVDANCRAKLEAEGLDVAIKTWVEIDTYPDRVPLACDEIAELAGGDIPALQILVTPDRSKPPDYGWVMFLNGTKQWIDWTCRDALEANGINVTVLSWSDIDQYPDSANYLDCQVLSEL